MKYLLTLALSALLTTASAKGAVDAVEMTKKSGENQIRHVIEPILEKYCRDDCKLLSVNVEVDLKIPDQIAPGFEETSRDPAGSIAPSSARVRLLVNEKIGPVSRTKLTELIEQYLDTLDYPVEIDTQLTRFPEPIENASRIVDLKERVTKQFRTTLEELFQQFCPNQCLLADYIVKADVVNNEEAQYGSAGEFIQDGNVAMRVREVAATLLLDENLNIDERANILEMARLKTSYLKNVNLSAKAIRFPIPPRLGSRSGAWDSSGVGGYGQRDGTSSDNKSTLTDDRKSSSNTTDSRQASSSETRQENSSQNRQERNTVNNSQSDKRQDRIEHYEKIERVENGDAVQQELKKFKLYGAVFGGSVLLFLVLLLAVGLKRGGQSSKIEVETRAISSPAAASSAAERAGTEDSTQVAGNVGNTSTLGTERSQRLGRKVQVARLAEELSEVFARQPKVAKHVFSRILTEEGLETAANYMEIFGESIMVSLLRDPSLQSDLNDLLEFYASHSIDLDEDEKFELLKRLQSLTVTAKLQVMGNRSSAQFDFIEDLDAFQIWSLAKNENLTIKSLVLTQCEPQKRSAIYNLMDDGERMKVLAELARIDHLPKHLILQASEHLRRKMRETPALDTEALHGSDVLVSLLEHATPQVKQSLIRSLGHGSEETVRVVKRKLISIDTLACLESAHLLEVILSIPHNELVQFLAGTPSEVRTAVLGRCPSDLSEDINEELARASRPSREAYQIIERKVLSKMKVMANEGLIDLSEANERLFASYGIAPGMHGSDGQSATSLRKVA